MNEISNHSSSNMSGRCLKGWLSQVKGTFCVCSDGFRQVYSDFTEYEISLKYDFVFLGYFHFLCFLKKIFIAYSWEILDFLYVSEKFPNSNFP